MAAASDKWLKPGAIVVPVPSRPSSVRRRGFDAVGLLAKHIAGVTRLPHARLLRRVGRSEQKTLTYEERMRNVAHSFIVRSRSCLTGLHIVLIDDVFTTGATLSACAQMLREAGAERVDCVSFVMEL